MCLNIVISHTVFRQFFVLCAGTPIIAIRVDGDASTGCEDARYLDVFRIHQADKVFHDDVYTILMEVSMIAEAEEV